LQSVISPANPTKTVNVIYPGPSSAHSKRVGLGTANVELELRLSIWASQKGKKLTDVQIIT
jgi:hypothetical protein